MPRDGSGVYTTLAGTQGVPNATISSHAYNLNVADVAQDLNTPRPVIAGGTGGSDATTARANLKAEATQQVVTDYNTFVFEAGSFVSNPGANGAPDAVNSWSGIAYINGALCTTLEARAVPPTSGVATGPKYVRTRNNTWTDWKLDTDLTHNKVDRAGDTMSGNLTITKTGPAVLLNKASDADACVFLGTANGLARWGVEPGDTGASNFSIDRYNDAGTYLDSPVRINRVTGFTTLTGNLVVTRPFPGPAISLAKALDTDSCGIFGTANGLTRWAVVPGDASGASHFSIDRYNNAGTYVDSPIGINRATGLVTLPDNVSSPTMFFAGTTAAFPGVGDTRIGGNVGGDQASVGGYIAVSRPNGPGVMVNSNTDSAVAQWFRSGVTVGYITVTSSSTFYATSCDGRLKDDIKSFDAGNIVDNTNIYNFAWIQTPRQIEEGAPIERAYGVIAQEAIDVYPEAVIHREEDDWYGVDYSKYVPVILQELKTLRARVAELEARPIVNPAVP